MTRLRAVLLVCAVVVASVLVAGCGSGGTVTPTHVAAVYVDAINHGDMRAACQTIQPAVVRRLWGKVGVCETYFTGAFGQLAAFGIPLGGYHVVAHSNQGWRERGVKVARVSVTGPDGSLLHVRLVKTKHGWKVASVG